MQLNVSDSPLYVSDSPLYVSDSPLYVSDSPLYVSDSPLYVSDSPLYVSEAHFMSQYYIFSVPESAWTYDPESIFLNFAPQMVIGCGRMVRACPSPRRRGTCGMTANQRTRMVQRAAPYSQITCSGPAPCSWLTDTSCAVSVVQSTRTPSRVIYAKVSRTLGFIYVANYDVIALESQINKIK